MEKKNFYERKLQLNIDEAKTDRPGWNTAVSGNGKRAWFVSRQTPNGTEYLLNKNGIVRRFGFEGAITAAEKANAKERFAKALVQLNEERRQPHRPGPGRSFEQAELEDEIPDTEACAVKVWSDNGIGSTKRLHIHDPRGTKILKGVIIAASDTQQLEGQLETLERELETIRNLSNTVMDRIGFAGEAFMLALETTLALLGTTIEKGIKS